MSPCALVAAGRTVLNTLEGESPRTHVVAGRAVLNLHEGDSPRTHVGAGRAVVDAVQGGSLAGGVPPAASSLPGDLQAHLLRGELSDGSWGLHRSARGWEAACQDTYKLICYEVSPRWAVGRAQVSSRVASSLPGDV